MSISTMHKYKFILITFHFLVTALVMIADARPNNIVVKTEEKGNGPLEGEESDEFPDFITHALNLCQ